MGVVCPRFEFSKSGGYAFGDRTIIISCSLGVARKLSTLESLATPRLHIACIIWIECGEQRWQTGSDFDLTISIPKTNCICIGRLVVKSGCELIGIL